MSGETITRDELAAYYRRHDSSSLASEASAAMADRIIADIEAHREPEYEPGTAYQDARGDVYLRSSIGDWVDRSGTRHGHTFPLRPLRRLVPAGSEAAKPVTHGQIVNVLAAGGCHTAAWLGDKADAIMELLGFDYG